MWDALYCPGGIAQGHWACEYKKLLIKLDLPHHNRKAYMSKYSPPANMGMHQNMGLISLALTHQPLSTWNGLSIRLKMLIPEPLISNIVLYLATLPQY